MTAIGKLPAAAIAWAVLFAAAVTAIPGEAHAQQRELSYNRDVRPILSSSCFACHGFDEHAREADLRLDTFADATAEREDSPAAIVPGDPDASELIARITHPDERHRMPPPNSGHELSEQEIEILRQWIAQGAEYEDHWAFIQPSRPALPEDLSQPDWVKNPIDAFVLAQLDQEGLMPSERADRRTLIRRVTLDLTGLPPTPEQVEAFVNDDREDAYERLVDRLLDSPRYGEHMARYWLDAARYADTHGYQYDLSRTMWPWREWVIQAFNRNMPFDQFTIEQLAGDLLPDATEMQRLASGFNRNHPATIEGGIIEKEYLTEYAMDRVETTGTVWLGMTMGCARCHDHKFDPITMEDFYSFYAFFNQVPQRAGLPAMNNDHAPNMQVTPPMQRERLAHLEQRIGELETQRDELLETASVDRESWQSRIGERFDSWSVPEPASMESAAGSPLERLEDGSVLVKRGLVEHDTYDVVLEVDGPVTAIRLEALTHESLPHGGPGRAPDANFVLSRVEVTAAPLEGDGEEQPVKIASASADFSQSGYAISNTLDGRDQTGWAVAGNERREDRTAFFMLEQPIEHEGGTKLRIRLIHNSGLSGAIGRFRLAVSDNDFTAVPGPVLALLYADLDLLDGEQRRRLDTFLLGEYGGEDARRIVGELFAVRQERLEIENNRPTVMVMAAPDEPKPTYVLEQGLYDAENKDRPVEPRTPESLPPMPGDVPRNRLGLARWIVSDENPLTARVTVNRFWQRLFGTGIVATTGDLGTQGEWPSHPRLLDWLAVEFVDSGWDVKHIMRTIVTSAAYQQSSRIRSDVLEQDPGNRLIARGPRQRLGAEAVRDNALAIAGLLSDKMGGPSVYPYQPDGLWEEINDRVGFSETYKLSEGEDIYRRSLYTFWKRTVPPPTLQAFDAPNREYCVVQRSSTSTPLQALSLMNDPQFVEAARFLAERMMREGGDSFEQRVTRGYELAVARKPSAEEVAVLRDLYQQQLDRYESDADAAESMLSVGVGPRDDSLDVVDHAAMTMIARTLLNLDETITKE